jgi:hypothetical protein
VTLPSIRENAGADRRAQESTVEMVSVKEEIARPLAAGSAARQPEPRPPQKIEFACPCGATLIATPQTYDKHLRCAMCQAVLLLSLVYDADCRSFEIAPFPVNPGTSP